MPPVTDPKTGALGEDLFESKIEARRPTDIHSVLVRSVTCRDAEYGVCARCYGVNLASGKPVNPGEAVGNSRPVYRRAAHSSR